MIPRKLEKPLKLAATRYPVVTVTGPRQSGKTTLVQIVFSGHQYVSLEDPEQRTFAVADPWGFLEQFEDCVILDEVQRAPDLFSYIQTIVDSADHPGKFILTGSQNFLLLRTIGHSLAGRCAALHLLPFSLSELMDWPDLPLTDIGRRIPSKRDPSTLDLFQWLFTGCYPRIHDKNLPAQDWLKNYMLTYIERDVRDLVNIGDLEAFQRVMGLCAGRTGQLLNLNSIATDCGVTHTTVRRWLSVLEASFIVMMLHPHHQNFNKRLIKSSKLYFVDTGLLCYLLRIRHAQDMMLHASRGAIFESFVVSELYKRALHEAHEPDLYFWRDSAGHEVDIIIDRGTELIPVEIKSGKTLTPDFFKGLDFWKKISGNQVGPAALIYAGDHSLRQKDHTVYAWWNF